MQAAARQPNRYQLRRANIVDCDCEQHGSVGNAFPLVQVCASIVSCTDATRLCILNSTERVGELLRDVAAHDGGVQLAAGHRLADPPRRVHLQATPRAAQTGSVTDPLCTVTLQLLANVSAFGIERHLSGKMPEGAPDVIVLLPAQSKVMQEVPCLHGACHGAFLIYQPKQLPNTTNS